MVIATEQRGRPSPVTRRNGKVRQLGCGTCSTAALGSDSLSNVNRRTPTMSLGNQAAASVCSPNSSSQTLFCPRKAPFAQEVLFDWIVDSLDKFARKGCISPHSPRINWACLMQLTLLKNTIAHCYDARSRKNLLQTILGAKQSGGMS